MTNKAQEVIKKISKEYILEKITLLRSPELDDNVCFGRSAA